MIKCKQLQDAFFHITGAGWGKLTPLWGTEVHSETSAAENGKALGDSVPPKSPSLKLRASFWCSDARQPASVLNEAPLAQDNVL